MAMRVFKEQLTGPYDGIVPATLAKVGGIVGGKNVRKVSLTGGWKARKGCTIHNTTALESGANVLSLHQYTHPRNGDYHFIAQSNGNLHDASNDPPANGAAFSSAALTALAGTAQPGFSDTVKDWWVYADGDGIPVMWGGDGPFCTGFVVWDNSAETYMDYTRDVTDGRLDTSAIVLGAASDVYYVCSPCIAKAIVLDLGTGVNSNAATATVKSWQAGAWSDRSASDGTVVTGKTHAQDGSLTWTASGSDTMRVISGIMGYWYQVSFSAALSGSVDVISCKIQFDPARISNKWSGVYETPLAVRFYDQSAGEYVDLTGKLTNESTSQYLQLEAATTSDEILVKSIEPLTGIGFGVVDDYEQTGNAQVDQIEYWDGDSWVAVTTGIIDETLDTANDSSFAQTGVIWWNAAALSSAPPKKSTWEWDSTPGYWYKITWDAALVGTSSDCRVYIVTVAPFPEAIPAYDGVVEFKGRAMCWGDPEHPNRLRFSAKGRPDCYSGSDSDWTDEFGDESKIVCAKRFYNELVVWKKNSVWLLEGYSPLNFGILKIADTVGCCAPKSTAVIEVGYPSMHADEPLSVALWVDTDGVYALDGRKPRKVSLPVDQYFNTEYSTAIAAASLDDLQCFEDKLNNEYHLLLNTTTELVYNTVLDQWYPPWVRTVGGGSNYLKCGINLRGTDGRYYTYGGTDAGFVMRLENDTTDKNASNADVAIEHSIKTRAISAEQQMTTTMEFIFRKVFIEAKARSSGTIVTNFYKDMASSGTAIVVPAAISLVNVGYSLVIDGVEASQQRCKTFQLEFVANTVDLEFEIYSFLYQIEVTGEFLT